MMKLMFNQLYPPATRITFKGAMSILLYETDLHLAIQYRYIYQKKISLSKLFTFYNLLIKFTSNYKITGTCFSPKRDENPEKLKNLLTILDILTILFHLNSIFRWKTWSYLPSEWFVISPLLVVIGAWGSAAAWG